MKRATKKKSMIIIAVLLAITLIISAIVAGIFAYFTDTESITNTFTIGNIDITLTEPLYTTALNGDANYGKNLMPGDTITKDPLIANTSTSGNDAYVFIKVAVPTFTVHDSTNNTDSEVPMFTLGTIGSGWELIQTNAATSSNNVVEYIYAYCNSGKTQMTTVTTSTTVPKLFTEITVASNLDAATTAAQISGNKNVVVTGYGIQKDGFESTAPATIWTQNFIHNN